jgi:hypothetical protein
MKNLNTNQKFIVVLAILVCLLVTSSSIFLAFSNKNTTNQDNLSKSNGDIMVNLKENAWDKTFQEKKYAENEMINISQGIILLEIDSTLTLVANAPFQAIYKDNTLNIISGVSYLEPKADLDLVVNGGELRLNKTIHSIYNPKESSIIILNGELKYNNNLSANMNEYLAWEVDSFNKYPFKRSLLSENKIFSNLIKSIQLMYQLPSELSDLTPPSLKMDAPQDGAIVATDVVLFSLTTEKQSIVTINDQVLSVDEEGVASMPFPLNLGENIFEIIAKDKFGNETKEVITVYWEVERDNTKDESPTSYPEE